MPNWCNNNITIQGPTETIKTLWEDATQEGAGLLSAIRPIPEILKDTTSPTPEDLDTVLRQTMIAQTGHTNWYDWSVSNWGTKWDVSTEGLEFEDNGDGTASISGWFDSAWSPPVGAYEAFLDDMDNCSLVASYYEPGMDFGGVWDNGEDEYTEDLHSQVRGEEDLWSPLVRQLDAEFGLAEQYEMWDE